MCMARLCDTVQGMSVNTLLENGWCAINTDAVIRLDWTLNILYIHVLQKFSENGMGTLCDKKKENAWFDKIDGQKSQSIAHNWSLLMKGLGSKRLKYLHWGKVIYNTRYY